jgi:hypothetical protein
MQRGQQLGKGGKAFGDVLGFFVLGIGAIGNFDVEVHAVLAQRSQRLPIYQPLLGRYAVDHDGGNGRGFTQDAVGALQQQGGDLLNQRRAGGAADFDGEDGHGVSCFLVKR